MDTVDGLWQQIEDWMRLHAPERLTQLAPGADEEALQGLERDLGITLPDDMRASYRRHNGGYRVHLVGWPMGIMPVTGMIYIWKILRELLDDEDWANTPPYYFREDVVRSGWQTGPLQAVWWCQSWIPFGEDGFGNQCCVDLAPAPGGAIGQIIDWDHECGPSRVLFPSFQELLKAFAKQLESSADKQDS